MKNLLIVVDMQNDFIDGSLGTKEAVAILPKVRETIEAFDGTVIFTKDTHYENYLDTAEGKKLPVKHCIKGTEGHEIHASLLPFVKSEPIEKRTFGSLTLSAFLQSENEKEPIESITLIGLCTDICVISNALICKATLPEVEIRVIASACAGVTPKSHENALSAMRMCQITVEE